MKDKKEIKIIIERDFDIIENLIKRGFLIVDVAPNNINISWHK